MADFAERMVKEGRLLPAQKGSTIELMMSLPDIEAADFSQADGTTAKKTPLKAYQDTMEAGPKLTDFSEKAPGAAGSADFSQSKEHWGAHYDANRKTFEAVGLSRERFLEQSGALNANAQ